MTTQGSRRFHPIVLVAGALGVALFVVALISQVVFHSSIDPTEQSFTVTLQNDTASAVTVKQCDATCNSFHERDQLAPGASVPVNTSSENVANWWLVADPSGRTIGCLPLRYNHKIDGLVVKISDHASCPAGTPASSSGVLGSIVGFALFFAVAGIGVASIVFTTISAQRWIAARGLGHGPSIAMTSLAALVAFFGGWLVFDFYVVIREGGRHVRRRVVPA
jgi:hypothetical protein